MNPTIILSVVIGMTVATGTIALLPTNAGSEGKHPVARNEAKGKMHWKTGANIWKAHTHAVPSPSHAIPSVIAVMVFVKESTTSVTDHRSDKIVKPKQPAKVRYAMARRRLRKM